jgi:hypothetical protein
MVNFTLGRLNCATLYVSHVRYCIGRSILRCRVTRSHSLNLFICILKDCKHLLTLYCCMYRTFQPTFICLVAFVFFFLSFSNVVVVCAASIGPRWWWREGSVYWCRGYIQATKTPPDSGHVIWKLNILSVSPLFIRAQLNKITCI